MFGLIIFCRMWFIVKGIKIFFVMLSIVNLIKIFKFLIFGKDVIFEKKVIIGIIFGCIFNIEIVFIIKKRKV